MSEKAKTEDEAIEQFVAFTPCDHVQGGHRMFKAEHVASMMKEYAKSYVLQVAREAVEAEKTQHPGMGCNRQLWLYVTQY